MASENMEATDRYLIRARTASGWAGITGVSLGSVYATGGIQKTYKYIYTEPGEFTITAVATNVGDKNYSGIDYSDQRSNSLNDYAHKRSLSTFKITVKN